jgi:hypothetical protein
MPFADAAAGKSIATSVATGNHRLIMRLDIRPTGRSPG